MSLMLSAEFETSFLSLAAILLQRAGRGDIPE